MMEFSDLIPLPLTKNICRTCLTELENNVINLHDVIDYEMKTVKLMDVLVFLGCIEDIGDDSWPQGICELCTSNVIALYHFKVTSLKAAQTLSQILLSHPSPNMPDIDSIDLNVIHQDHEYEIPMLLPPPNLFNETNPTQDLTITPVLPQQAPQNRVELPKVEKEKPFSCSFCPSTFTKIYGLRYHMEKHLHPKRKLCQLCGKNFNTIGGLRQHLLTHKSARFKCGVCDKNYKSKQTMQEHYRVAHSNNRYAYSCPQCKRNFTAKASLTSHMLTHNLKRDAFPCPDCPKKYATAKSLRVHSQLHTAKGQIKKFPCTYVGCDKTYATKYCLILHVSYSHKGDRPYKCDVCPKTFVTKSNLSKHSKMHNDLSCNICNQKCINKRILKNHIREHGREC